MRSRKEILQREINEVQEKQESLCKLITVLEVEYFSLVEKADKEQNILFVTKPSAMKRKRDEKKLEVEQLKKALGILIKKKKDIN